MSTNLTSFLYLKVLKKTENTDYKLAHTLFHLQRFLFLHEGVKWERVFWFKKDRETFEDWGGSLAIKLLWHHTLIVPADNANGYSLNLKGNERLNALETQLAELNSAVERFFDSYQGETVYTNSCVAATERKFVACHLCDKPICVQKESFLTSSLKSISKPLLKSPYRSYSSAVAN